MEGYRKPDPHTTAQEKQTLFLLMAWEVYQEAGAPYGESWAGLTAWFMEGGFGETAGERAADTRFDY